METITLSRVEVGVSEPLPADLRTRTLQVLAEVRVWRLSPTGWGHVGPLLAALRTAGEADMADDVEVLIATLTALSPVPGCGVAMDALGLPADLRTPLADLVRLFEAPYSSGKSTPRSDSGRPPKIRRSLSSIGRSLMLASRRVIRP